MIAFLFISFVVLLLMGVPIAFTLLLSAAVTIYIYTDYQLQILPSMVYLQSDSFPLIAIPFFVLAGAIMSKGGMSDRLIRFAMMLVGTVRGGLAMVSVVACMMFASISGSTAATTAAIGTVMMPAVVRSGFKIGTATGLQATAGSIGIIIPPSIPFILMGVIGGMSIGELFMGGVFPGLAVGVSLMVMAHIIARIEGHAPSGETVTLKSFISAAIGAILPLLTVVFVVGSIMLGWVVPTEAAIIAVLWALLVSVVVYRDLKFSDMPEILMVTVKITGIVVFVIGATAPFAWLLTIEQVPQMIVEAMTAVSSAPWALKLMMLAIILMIGTFLDLTPAMIILVPIMLPIANRIGMDPIQFGVMMVLGLGIGQSTPPVGIALFVACSVARIKITKVIVPILPFLAAMILVLLLVAFWAPISTWLPTVTMRGGGTP